MQISYLLVHLTGTSSLLGLFVSIFLRIKTFGVGRQKVLASVSALM